MRVRSFFQDFSIIDKLTMNLRTSNDEANKTRFNEDRIDQVENFVHLIPKILCCVIITFKEMSPGSDFPCFHSQRIESEPPHSIFVIEPIFIGIWIGWRSNN